jgi:hypothetical protein
VELVYLAVLVVKGLVQQVEVGWLVDLVQQAEVELVYLVVSDLVLVF